VIGDIMEAAEGSGGSCNWLLQNESLPVRGAEDISVRCYLRLSLKDQPEAIAQVSHVLGKNHISIGGVMQKEQNVGEQVPVVFLTHHALEKDFVAAMKEIAALNVVDGEPVRMAIEDFD